MLLSKIHASKNAIVLNIATLTQNFLSVRKITGFDFLAPPTLALEFADTDAQIRLK